MNKTPHTLPPIVIYLFMTIGLVSAVAFRSLTIFGYFNEALVRPAWYVGVIGYILFFAYRYHISEKRKKTIREYNLLEKVKKPGEISAQDRELIEYLLSSISKSKENINYLFIFALSIVAIAADIILSLRRG